MSGDQQLALHANQQQERPRQDEAVRRAREILAAVAAPVVVVDSHWRLRTANREFFRTFRLPAGDTAGSEFCDRRRETGELLRVRLCFERILAENTGSSDFEVEQEFPGIGRRAIRFRIRPMSTAETAAPIRLVCVEDITDRRRMQKQVNRCRRQLQRLASGWLPDQRPLNRKG